MRPRRTALSIDAIPGPSQFALRNATIERFKWAAEIRLTARARFQVARLPSQIRPETWHAT